MRRDRCRPQPGRKAAPAPPQIPALHYHFTDPLGTRRLQADSQGVPELDCQSLPFGDQLNCFTDPNGNGNLDDSTPLHFTGKERDTETGEANGNDYFGARYFASGLGRFMTPDWSAKYEPVPYARLDNPQTLNLYAYVQNNPLTMRDPDGHEDAGTGGDSSGGDGGGGDSGDSGSGDLFDNFGGLPTTASPATTAGKSQNQQLPHPVTNVQVHETDPGSCRSSLCQFTAWVLWGAMRAAVKHPSLIAPVLQSKAIQHENPNATKGARPVKDKNGKIIGWSIPAKGADKGKRISKGLDWGKENGLDPNDPKWQKMGISAGAGAIGATILSILEDAAAAAAL